MRKKIINLTDHYHSEYCQKQVKKKSAREINRLNKRHINIPKRSTFDLPEQASTQVTEAPGDGRPAHRQTEQPLVKDRTPRPPPQATPTRAPNQTSCDPPHHQSTKVKGSQETIRAANGRRLPTQDGFLAMHKRLHFDYFTRPQVCLCNY